MLKLSKIVIAEGDIGSPVQTATLFGMFMSLYISYLSKYKNNHYRIYFHSDCLIIYLFRLRFFTNVYSHLTTTYACW